MNKLNQLNKELNQDSFSRKELDTILSSNQLTPQGRRAILEYLHNIPNWKTAIYRFLTLYGALLIFSGCILFIIFNINLLSLLFKLSVIELGLIASFIVAFLFYKKQNVFKASLLSSSFFIILFMMMDRIIYQSSLQFYELFFILSGLILPLAILANSFLLWLLWIGLCNLSLMDYWQECVFGNLKTDDLIFTIQILMNAFFLLISEYIIKHHPSMKALRISLIAWLLLLSFIPSSNLILIITLHRVPFESFSFAMMIAGIVGLGLNIALFRIYSTEIKNVFALSLISLSLALLACILLYCIVQHIHMGMIGLLSITTLSVIGIFSVVIRYLIQFHQKNQTRKHS